MKFDIINKPRHYNVHPSGVECVEITEHLTGNLANAWKYLWRCEEKEKHAQDLGKGKYYINREKQRVHWLVMNAQWRRCHLPASVHRKIKKVFQHESGERLLIFQRIYQASQESEGAEKALGQANKAIETLIRKATDHENPSTSD